MVGHQPVPMMMSWISHQNHCKKYQAVCSLGVGLKRASEKGRSAEPSSAEKKAEAAVEPEKIQAETENGDAAGAKRTERAWRRRVQVVDRSVKADPGTDGNVEMNGKELEKELGDQVVRHFQFEAARLQQQNDEFQMELPKIGKKWIVIPLPVPPSWVPKSPPRMTPPMESHRARMSPESFLCTPNGTRVPLGPPPPCLASGD